MPQDAGSLHKTQIHTF